MNLEPNGLHLVDPHGVLPRDTQSLADEIVDRVRHEYARELSLRPQIARVFILPSTAFQPRRETPLTVFRRVLNVFPFNA
jgi:hypothetical protein